MSKGLMAALEEAQEAMRPFWEERQAIRDAECPARIEKLRDLHINIDSIGGNCPVQAEGTVKGQPFYFRARGEHWSLEIGPRELWHTGDIWQYEEPYGEWPAAGWMHDHEALDFIEKAAGLWLAERKNRRPRRARDTHPKDGDAKQGSAREWPGPEGMRPNDPSMIAPAPKDGRICD